MDKLPDNIKRIDVLRIEHGKRKMCQCINPHYEIDYANKLVTCVDCGAIIDPMTALYKIARHYEHLNNQVELLLEQRKEIENYKPHLVVMKNLEQRYREQNYGMAPVCPRCSEPFDLSEITHWCSKEFLKLKD